MNSAEMLNSRALARKLLSDRSVEVDWLCVYYVDRWSHNVQLSWYLDPVICL